MKELNFNTKSWHGLLWSSTWGTNLPNNICGYFWSLVLAILICPFAIFGHILNMIPKRTLDVSDGENNCKAFWWVFTIPILVIMSLPWWEHVKNPTLFKMLLFGALDFIIFVLFLFIITGIGYLFEQLKYKYSDYLIVNTPKKIKKSNPLIEGFKAFKGKYCSQIKWN